MKQHIFILLVMLTTLTSFSSNNDKVIISGTITGDINESVEYTSSINGACFWGFPKSIVTDALGNFTVILNIDKTAFFQILIGTYSYGILIIEPDNEYKIHINLNLKEKSIEPICKNATGQKFYNKLFKKNTNLIVRKYNNYENISAITKELALSKTSETEEFKKLLINGDISEQFFKLVKLDRECFYSLIKGKAVRSRCFKALRNNISIPNNVKTMWAKIFQEIQISTPNLSSSFWYYPLLENFMSFKTLSNNSFDKEKLIKLQKQGLIHTHNINISKNYLDGSKLEYYQARYLYESAMQMKFEEELINLFEGFKKEFPESEFSNFLYPMVNPISDYLDNKKQTDKNFKFVQNYENLNSLKECLIPFKGKKVYVDVWATWCLPCRAQFKHKDKLKQLLETKDIEILYLSIDNGARFEKKWKELINFYGLEGNHIRANPKLYSDLKRIFDNNGTITIPWYLIIDEQGNITVKHAKAPSQVKDLEIQLN